MLQTTIPVRVSDLLQTMPQLRMALTNAADDTTVGQEHRTKTKPSSTAPVTKPGTDAIDPMLLTVSIGRKPVVVEMEIIGQKLTTTIVDGV